jgi:hypothetical protein
MIAQFMSSNVIRRIFAHSNQGTYAATPAFSKGFPEQLVPIVEARKKTRQADTFV